jgi:hypothetical protein
MRDLMGSIWSLILRTCGRASHRPVPFYLGHGAGHKAVVGARQVYLEVVAKRSVLLLFRLCRTLPWSR